MWQVSATVKLWYCDVSESPRLGSVWWVVLFDEDEVDRQHGVIWRLMCSDFNGNTWLWGNTEYLSLVYNARNKSQPKTDWVWAVMLSWRVYGIGAWVQTSTCVGTKYSDALVNGTRPRWFAWWQLSQLKQTMLIVINDIFKVLCISLVSFL